MPEPFALAVVGHQRQKRFLHEGMIVVEPAALTRAHLIGDHRVQIDRRAGDDFKAEELAVFVLFQLAADL